MTCLADLVMWLSKIYGKLSWCAVIATNSSEALGVLVVDPFETVIVTVVDVGLVMSLVLSVVAWVPVEVVVSV